MTDKASRSPVSAWLVIVGVGYQWFYNGANFLAFKVGGDAFHPLMLAALRFGVAALLLLPFAAILWRRNTPTLREIGASSGLGIVMLVGGQALAIWGTHFLPPASPLCLDQPRRCFWRCSPGSCSGSPSAGGRRGA